MRAGFIRDHLQNLEVERMEGSTCSPDLNPIEHLWDQLGCAVHSRLINTTTDLGRSAIFCSEALPRSFLHTTHCGGCCLHIS
uniref:Tc1-like transposase DDE domain-containing protein n=1 Tax=Labrus bergylta TaxID=56723 RepID=A0A3Q3FGY2_9LABR